MTVTMLASQSRRKWGFCSGRVSATRPLSFTPGRYSARTGWHEPGICRATGRFLEMTAR